MIAINPINIPFWEGKSALEWDEGVIKKGKLLQKILGMMDLFISFIVVLAPVCQLYINKVIF
jgi:hypothetical protein